MLADSITKYILLAHEIASMTTMYDKEALSYVNECLNKGITDEKTIKVLACTGNGIVKNMLENATIQVNDVLIKKLEEAIKDET